MKKHSTPNYRQKVSRQILGLLAVLVSSVAVGRVHAAAHHWTGPTGGLWSEPANWTGGIPTTGEVGGTTVHFETGTSSVCDIEVTLDLLDFSGPNNEIVGSGGKVLSFTAAVLAENIVSTTGLNTIGGANAGALPIQIVGNGDITIKSIEHTLHIAASIANKAGSTGGVRYTGPAVIQLTSVANTYVGQTTVVGGTLQLNSASEDNKTVPGHLVIGSTDEWDNTTSIVSLSKPSQIADTATVTLWGGASLDLLGEEEGFGLLQINGGTITAGTLHLGGDIVAISTEDFSGMIDANITLNAASRKITVGHGLSYPDLHLRGSISDGISPSGLTIEGEGSAFMSTPGNTYTGVTTVLGGDLRVTHSAGVAIPGDLVIGIDGNFDNLASVSSHDTDNNLASQSKVTIRESGLFYMDAVEEHLGSLSGKGEVELNTDSALIVGGAEVDSVFEGYIGEYGSLTKVGSKTLTLTGEVYLDEKDVLIEGGTLAVDGFLDVLMVKIGSGATLSGKGIITGDVASMAIDATVAPAGDDLGSLTIDGSVDFGTGGALKIQINDANPWRSDDLSVGENVDLSGCNFQLLVTGTLTRNAYVLVSYATPENPTPFASVTGVPAGYELVYDYINGAAQRHVALIKTGISSTGGATAVTSAGAKLNGIINPSGKVTTYYFQYGETTQYGNRTSVAKGLTGSGDKDVSAVVTKLNGGTVYHFQLVMNNSDGVSYGADFTFLTPGPLVQTIPYALATSATARLEASVDPDGATTTAWFEYGRTPALGSKTAVQLVGSTSPQTIRANLTGLVFDQTYFYRVVATSAAGTSRGRIETFNTEPVVPPFVVLGSGSDVSAEGRPAFFMVLAEELSPDEAESYLTFQWYKNKAAIPGATGPAYLLFSAKLADAGTYTCVVKNAAGTATSPPIEFGVIEAPSLKNLSQPVGGKLTLSFKAAGNGLTYQWIRGVNSEIPGARGPTLALTSLQTADAGSYSCRVSNSGGSARAGEFRVSVNSGVPIILPPVTPPDAIVGGPYSFQIPINTSPNVAPTSFTIKNLPAGLTVSAGGLISGRIAKSHPTNKTYSLLIKAANASGSTAEVPASLVVRSFPANLVGPYNGIVDRGSWTDVGPDLDSFDGGLGGIWSMTIADTGVCSGKLNIAGVSQAFTVIVQTSTGSSTGVVQAPITFGKRGTMFLTFLIDNDGAIYGSIADSKSSGSVIFGSLNPWKAVGNPFPHPGMYTVQMGLHSSDVGDPEYPQGTSYATVNISAAGLVNWVGKMADGSAPATFATGMGDFDEEEEAYFDIHFMLSANTASVMGYAWVKADDQAVNGGKALLEGDLDWIKKRQDVKSKERAYREGFSGLALDTIGGIYTAPPANTPILELTPAAVGATNAELVFEGGDLSPEDSAELNRLLRITTTNTTDFGNAADNPNALKMKIDAKTGIISGTFLVTDGDISRPVPFNGILVPRQDVRSGAGFFLRPETFPTVKTSAIQSGLMLLLPP